MQKRLAVIALAMLSCWICAALQAAKKADGTEYYPRLMRVMVPSPSGKNLVMRVEHWENGKAVSRTLDMYVPHENTPYLFYSLTPQFMEVVEGPEPHLIAFLAKSGMLWYSMHSYSSEKKIPTLFSGSEPQLGYPVMVTALSTREIRKNLQFSKDGLFLRHVMGTYASTKERYPDRYVYAIRWKILSGFRLKNRRIRPHSFPLHSRASMRRRNLLGVQMKRMYTRMMKTEYGALTRCLLLCLFGSSLRR